MMLGYIFIYEYTQHSFGITSVKQCYTNIINRSIKHNVLIVKIMQALTAKHELDPEIHAVLTENTHNVKYDDEELDQLLLDNICKNYNIHLLDNKPAHSGMISIVYLGEQHGKKVVIKMKRKDIVNRIKRGSDNVNFIYSLLRKVFAFNSKIISQLESLKSITKTQEYLISQCDFGKEIDALITTKQEIAQYSVCKNVVIPHVYNIEEDIQNGHFIIMEFLEGKFASDITDDCERKTYYRIFAGFIAIHTWFGKYFHTDMHNGNVICMNDNGIHKIGIIDFGMNVKMSKDIQTIFMTFADIAYTTGFENAKLHKHINSFLTKPIDISKLTDIQLDIIDKSITFMALHMQSGDLNEEHINKGYNEMADAITPQFELVLNMNFILIMLGVSMGNSTVRVMMKNDTKTIEDTLKELYFEIME
jgi:predicted unusual protein kinase regulating ubiquinone biosynthesis (AarF/ABC1/UbiB family)